MIEKNVSDLIGPTFNNKFVIKNIDKLDWKKDFDTLILGHVNQLSNALGKNLLYELLKKCKEYKKSIYAFDNLSKYKTLIDEMEQEGIKVFYPKFIESYIPTDTFGKLKRISQPVLGIFGTSPKQGKYTLQLILRKLFIENGYDVGQLGTEPSALLFGFDEVFPMGYGSTVNTFGVKSIEAINYLMGKIQDKNPDIILVGSQSQTIPLTYGNIGFYPPSYDFILGCEPDAYILCVNVNDELDYIDRTIKYLESVVPAKVLSLVIFPFCRNLKWSVLGNSFKCVDENMLENRRKELSSIFKKKVFILNRTDEMKLLFQECVNYFAQ